ncbi:MAG TPA: response regulator transcription factor [Acidimicrobiales bacterium]|nr:response regulator transcription factor [Acidimicrobiales bacterium]
MRVLLLEDDGDLRHVLARRLRKEGFAVDEASRLVEAAEALRLHEYDCLVFDRLVPDGDALDLVARQRHDDFDVAPVLFLSARSAVADRIAGFAAGADDYVTKPFELTELSARVRALCRRRGGLRPSLERCGDLVVDRALRAVRRGGVLLSLTPKEFSLLEVLVDARGTAVSREELIDRCWDERADMFSNAVNVHIAALRRKLGPPPLIETVRGGGYALDVGPAP